MPGLPQMQRTEWDAAFYRPLTFGLLRRQGWDAAPSPRAPQPAAGLSAPVLVIHSKATR